MDRDERAAPENAYEALLRDIRINTAARRRHAAASLMRLVAAHLQSEEPLPRPVRNWLSRLLIDGSMGNASAERLVWVMGRGRPVPYDRDAEEFAHVYALMQWGWTQDAAAQAVANHFTRKQSDSAATKKRARRARVEWIAEGPFRRMRPDGDPPEATMEDLRNGEDVIVDLTTPKRARTLTIPLDKAVLAARDKYAE